MAFITADIKCPDFQRTVPVRLYFPTDLPESVGNKVNGVITLLHGMGNSSADWMMYSAAPRYAADNGYILVAPDASNSFYNNMVNGAPFFTMLTEELPRQLRSIFKIPDEREKNFICGLSMGGYGALRIGLAKPECYSAIGSFSGAPDVSSLVEATRGAPLFGPMLAGVFGENTPVPQEASIDYLAGKASQLPERQRPRILLTCGRQDILPYMVLEQNHALRDTLEALPLDMEYREWDGVHEWNFWDRSLAEFIGFIQNSDYAERKKNDWK